MNSNATSESNVATTDDKSVSCDETTRYLANLEHLNDQINFSFADVMSASSLLTPEKFHFPLDDEPNWATEAWDPTEENTPIGVEDVPAFSLQVSKRGLNMIVMFEISSEAYFNLKLIHPIWPQAASGITIGIGYDLGYNSASTIRSDWSMLDKSTLDGLVTGAGVTGQAAKNLLPQLKSLTVPLVPSKKVFYSRTLVKFARLTRSTYPEIEKLPADTQAALLSLVFNRGNKLTGDSRKEMASIQPLVKNGDLKGIADQIRAMKRLWNKATLPGLHIRRDKEADMVQNARSIYPSGEIISL